MIYLGVGEGAPYHSSSALASRRASRTAATVRQSGSLHDERPAVGAYEKI